MGFIEQLVESMGQRVDHRTKILHRAGLYLSDLAMLQGRQMLNEWIQREPYSPSKIEN